MNTVFSAITPDSLSTGAIVARLALFVILCTGLVLDICLVIRWRQNGIPAPDHADRLLARHWHWRDALWLAMVMAVFLASLALVGKLFETQIENLAVNAKHILIIIQNLVTQGLAIGLVLHLQRQSGSTFAESLGGPPERLSTRLRQALTFYVAAMPLILAAGILSYFLLSALNIPFEPQPVLGGFIDTTVPLWFKFWLIVTAVIVAPIVEETVFRGVLFPALARHRGIPAAVVVVSLLFALIHGHPPSLLPLFIVGATLATAYLYTGSLLVPIYIHTILNSVTLATHLLSGVADTP